MRIDDEGSLRIIPEKKSFAHVQKLISVKGPYIDSDGIDVHVLLHTPNGMPSELEFYKDDGSSIVKRPCASEVDVIVLPPHKNERPVG